MKKYVLLLLYFAYYTGQAQPNTTRSSLKTLDNSVSFLALGDFGRAGAFGQKDIAKNMGVVAEYLDSDFIVSVGDNFYPSGVASTQDYHWTSSYESIYEHHLLYHPWYVALGNHDYQGNIQAQIDYTQVSRRWYMPSPYYEKIIPIDPDSQIQLLVIDTNPMITNYQKQTEKYPQLAAQDSKKQLEWLEERLQQPWAKTTWKIVVGHHPMYSGGKRKTNPDTFEVEKILADLFDQYRVEAYICGHEHDLQIIKPQGRYTTQFLSGAGSELRPTGQRDGTLYAGSHSGFMTFTLNKNTLLVQTIKANTDDFEILHQIEISKPQ